MAERSPQARRRLRANRVRRLKPRIDALTADLSKHYPHVFATEPDAIRPLKKGIYHDVCAARPDVSRMVVYATIGCYTSQRAYLEALAAGHARIDLSGAEVEPVTEKEQRLAQRRLAREAASRESSATRNGERAPGGG